MGAALACAALECGYEPIVVSGPVEVEYPKGADVRRVITTDDMREVAVRFFPECVGAIGAAAPCDYRPFTVLEEKMTKDDFIRKPEQAGELLLRLRETPDVMAALGEIKRDVSHPLGGQWLVAFALETSDHHVRALQKLQRKHCDLIVVNDPSAINVASSSVEILNSQGESLARLSGNKVETARRLLYEIKKFVENKTL